MFVELYLLMKNDPWCQRLVASLFLIAFIFGTVGASGIMQSGYTIYTFLFTFAVASLLLGIILLLSTAIGYCYSPVTSS